MAHAFANGFPGMAGNLNGDLGQGSLADFSQALHGSNAGQSMSSMYADHTRRSMSASTLQQADLGANMVPGLGSGQHNWLAQQADTQPGGLAAHGSDYDNFLASAGLGVKSQRPQPVPGMPPLSRGNSGMDLLASAQQNGMVPQRHSPNIPHMFANMTRIPSNGQLTAAKPYLPPGLAEDQSYSRGLLPQGFNASAQPPPRSDNQTPPAAAAQNHLGEAGRDAPAGDWPLGRGNLVSQSSGLSNAFPGSNLAPEDIQQLLNSMGNYPASMPEQISRPSSRASNAGTTGAPRHASGGSVAEMLAAQQPRNSPPTASATQGPPAENPLSEGNGLDAPPPKSEPGGEREPPPATQAAETAEQGTGVSAFAAVANVALDEDAAKGQDGGDGQPPASTVSTMAGQAPLAPNLFDPSYAVPPGNSTLNNPLLDPAGLATAARAQDYPAGLPSLDMNAMQQLQQQLGGNASYNDIMEIMRLQAQQQALAQQRMQAARAGSGQGPGVSMSGGMAAGGLTNQAGAGLMNRNAMLQQLNKNQLPQPLPERATPPPGGALPFGMSEPRLSGGIDAFGNVAPKPQPSPQQMRFGGNIGVHAINRTSAPQLPAQAQLQQRAMFGGGPLGINNPLTAGLAGTVPGAPRPGMKPNWQAQRVQTHAQAAVAAQQAAQVQQVQAIRLAAAKAQAQAQLNAQLNAQLQAQAQQAQVQANRNNLLAGLTPAQLNMLMNAPPQQLNQMAAQLGLLDSNPVVTGLGGMPNAGLGGMGLTQQQKLMAAAAAARGGYAPPPPQRQAPRPMLSQQQLQQLYAQQAAQQAAQQGRVTPSLLNPALAGLGNVQQPGGVQNNLQPGGAGGAANNRAALVDMGRGLAQAGFTVEQAVNSGLLGGFSAFDVRALSEGHQAEMVRMRAARAAVQQNAQANAQQQQMAQQQFQMRQTQLQQLQQAQAAAAAAAASRAGSDAGSHGAGTPKTPAPIMNLGPGSLGQLFDWQPNQGQPPQSQSGNDLLSANWDLTSTQLLGGLSSAQANIGPPGSHGGGFSGPNSAANTNGLGLGPIVPRPGSDAGGSEALFPPSLRSRSPWEGAPGGGLGAIQPGSARSGVSSHATTPRSRPGTMSSLLDMGNVFGPPANNQQPPFKYSSQGSLDGELPSHMRGAPGAQAPIGDGRVTKSGQGEVPASLRAFWESGGVGGAPDRPLSKAISLDSARPPVSGGHQAASQGLPTGANAMEPAMDLEALDAALEAAANAANAAAAESSAPHKTLTPEDLDTFTASSYSFFNMQSPLEDDSIGAMGALSLEGELEGEGPKDKVEASSGLDDTGMTEVAGDLSKSAP